MRETFSNGLFRITAYAFLPVEYTYAGRYLSSISMLGSDHRKIFPRNDTKYVSVVIMPLDKRLLVQKTKTNKAVWLPTFTAIIVVFCLAIFALFTFAAKIAVAQSTYYEVVGVAEPIDTIHNIIYNVKVNDQVLVSISPDSTEEYYYSYVYYPNQTLIESEYTSGSHSYNFIAETSGDYVLSFKTGSGFGAGAGFNYTIKSSHALTPSQTQLSIVAIFQFSPLSPLTNESITFDASNSHSDEGTITNYSWNFGDGTTETISDPTASHMYLEQGDFTVTLTVYDTAGNQNTTSTIIAVSSLPTREAIPAPMAIGAGVAATSTTLAIGMAAAKLSSSRSVTTSLSPSDMAEIPHSELQRFLNFLVGEEQEEKGKAKKKARPFFYTKRGQLTAVAISVSIMTIILSYVEANGVPRILDPNVLAIVVPSTFLSSVSVKLVSILTDTVCAQSCGVDKKYALWPIGLITFILTGLFVLFPFGVPGITKTYSRDLPPKENALLIVSKTLLLLAMAFPFAVLSFLGFNLVADAGLLSVLTLVFFSLVPISPLPGKSIANYNNVLAIGMLLLMGFFLYGLMLKILPPLTYLIVGVVSAALGLCALYRLRKSAH